MLSGKSIGIKLGDRLKCTINARDRYAKNILSQLSMIMCLQPCKGNFDKYIILQTSTNREDRSLIFLNNNTIICTLYPFDNPEMIIINIIWLSLVIAKVTHAYGGFLLHGALAEYKGSGVIMAGSGGIGKTTASQNLRPPWKSLSDDCNLVVPTSTGEYRAHPWPTWSRFVFGGKGGSWNVEYNVKLQAVFFLSRIPAQKPEPISLSKATAMMIKSSEQAWGQMMTKMEKHELVKLRQQIFMNVCRLVKYIPCYILSLNGNFQEQMEQVIDGL